METVRPKLPPTVDEMLDEIKPRLPTLDDEALRVVLTFFTGYVGNDDIPVVKVDQETALTELELTHGWKKKDITAACEQLMQDLADVLGRLNEEFEEATGSEVRTADFEIFKKRYAEERQEQAALVSRTLTPVHPRRAKVRPSGFGNSLRQPRQLERWVPSCLSGPRVK